MLLVFVEVPSLALLEEEVVLRSQGEEEAGAMSAAPGGLAM